MESASRAEAAAQLGELSEAVDSANDNAEPAPSWWAPLALGLIGPAHVAIFHGSTLIAVVMVVAAVAGAGAALFAERRAMRAHRRAGQRISLRRFVGIFGLIIGLQIAGRWFASDERTTSAWLLAPAAWAITAALIAVAMWVMAGRSTPRIRS